MTYFYTNVERMGQNILARGYENGKKYYKKVKFEPTFYVAGDGGFSSLSGVALRPKSFESMYDAKNFIDQYKDIAGFRIAGSTNYVTQYINDIFPEEIQFDASMIDVGVVDIEVDTVGGYPDLEKCDKEITAITFYRSSEDLYHVFSLVPYDKMKTELKLSPDKIRFTMFESERKLMSAFLDNWSSNYVDVISGWNSKFFDIYYIGMRLIFLMGEDALKKLSPWNSVRKFDVEMFGKKQYSYSIMGISNLDYLDVFKKFGYSYGTQETYKLDHIANLILGDAKLDYSEYGTLAELMINNPQKYVDYNIKDTEIVVRIEDKITMLVLAFTMAYRAGCNYEDTLGTTGIWEAFIYREMMKERVVPELKKGAPAKEEFEGGYVKEPQKGMHKWLTTVDLASLYPHEIIEFNMSPETYIEDPIEWMRARLHMVSEQDVIDYINSEEIYWDIVGGKSSEEILAGQWPPTKLRKAIVACDVALAPNGACFDKTEIGFIPKIIKMLYARRAEAKNKMLAIEQQIADLDKNSPKYNELERQRIQLNNEQMSVKIFMNSLYGAFGNVYFLYYVRLIAQAITLGGQLSIKLAEKQINESMNSLLGTDNVDYVVYIDTDSVAADSTITVDGEEWVVDEFFDQVDGEVTILPSGAEIKKLKRDCFTPSVDPETGDMQNSKIEYVMRHDTSKEMFEIVAGGKTVQTTSDHSLMVFRDGKFIEVKPMEVMDGDLMAIFD